MRPTRPTLRSGAVLALALTLTSTACGDGASERAQPSPAASSATTGPSPTPSAPTEGSAISGAALSERVTAAVQKAGSGTFSVTQTPQAPGGSGEGVFAITDAGVSVRVETLSDGEELEVLFVPGVTYLRSGTEPWLKIDEGNADDPMSAAMAPMMSALRQQMDPTTSLALFASASEVTVGTTTELDGVAATAYTAQVPVEAMLAQMAEQMEALGAGELDADTKEQLIERLGESLPVTAWLDEQDRPVQIEQVVALGGEKATTTTTMSDWGQPVDVTEPPAADVAG